MEGRQEILTGPTGIIKDRALSITAMGNVTLANVQFKFPYTPPHTGSAAGGVLAAGTTIEGHFSQFEITDGTALVTFAV